MAERVENGVKFKVDASALDVKLARRVETLTTTQRRLGLTCDAVRASAKDRRKDTAFGGRGGVRRESCRALNVGLRTLETSEREKSRSTENARRLAELRLLVDGAT